VLAVGAPSEDSGFGGHRAGVVHIYDASDLTEIATMDGDSRRGGLGHRLAFLPNGDGLLAGAPRWHLGGRERGAVYHLTDVFVPPEITEAPAELSNFGGSALAGVGDGLFVVGASTDTDAGGRQSGALYLFAY